MNQDGLSIILNYGVTTQSGVPMNGDTKWSEVATVFLVMMYNLTVLVGTTYLVAERGWSMWCYLLALCFIFNVKTGKAADAKKD